MTTVIVNDFMANRRINLFFSVDDFETIDDSWEDRDRLLKDLQRYEFFRGYERWCDLTVDHFRLLVAKSLESASFLADEDRLDDDNPVVQSANHMIAGLIRCLERASNSTINLMTINRVGEIDIAVDFQGSMPVQLPINEPTQRPGPFSVVVDNTKKPNE